MKALRGYGLADVQFSGSEAKSLDSTALNNAVARESSAHISGTNETKEYITPKASLGKLGAKGKVSG